MLDYGFTEYQTAIRDLAHEIAEKEIRPIAAEYDREAKFPWPAVKVMAETDLFRVYIEDEYGGISDGSPIMNMVIVTEELSKACGGIALAFAGTALGTLPIVLSGNEEQKKQWLPDIAAGKKLAAFALTEPQAGSDAGAVRTTALRDGDHYILNGTKQWITNGGEAEIYTVIALTNPSKGPRGASCIVVEKGTPGFTFGKKEDKLGIRASSTTELILDDVEVPEENVLGPVGQGYKIAIETLNEGRIGIGAQMIGVAGGALRAATDYVKERAQFGKRLAEFQGIQFQLAQARTELEAARLMVYNAARLKDAGQDIAMEGAMAKLFSAQVAERVTSISLELFGGYGYTKDYPAEKFYRDAKIGAIYEGTSNMQLGTIAKGMLK